VSRAGRQRRFFGVLAGVLGTVMLLLPARPATADDDPGPVDWPKIEQPDAGGNGSDPEPVKWATISPPENNGTASDPEPVNWPAPERG
jgi:hypothetical protein